MRKKTIASVPFFLLLMNIFNINMSLACIGRTIYIGQEKTSESMLLAEMLAIFIRERTDTTAVVKVLEQNEKGHDLLEKGDLDIFVEYTCAALIEVLKKRIFPRRIKYLRL
ncbi:MAG: hypothetical protein AB1498_13085 [bacterium]